MLPVTTCPETVDLYDHLEGTLSLDSHLTGCAACRASLASLKSALDVEAAAFAPPSELEVERALLRVRARGAARVRRPWAQTALAFAAAAVTLAVLMPSAFELPDSCRPISGPSGTDAVIKPSGRVDAPRGIGEGGLDSLGATTTASSSLAVVVTSSR